MRQHVWPFGHCASGFGQRTSKIFWTTSTFSCLFTKKVCIFCEKKTRQINLNGLSKLGVKVRNMKMDFNTGGIWRWVRQCTLMMKIYDYFFLACHY